MTMKLKSTAMMQLTSNARKTLNALANGDYVMEKRIVPTEVTKTTVLLVGVHGWVNLNARTSLVALNGSLCVKMIAIIMINIPRIQEINVNITRMKPTMRVY